MEGAEAMPAAVVEAVGVGVTEAVVVTVADAVTVTEAVTETVTDAMTEDLAANLHSHFFPVQYSCFISETNMLFSLTLQMLICTDLYPSESCCSCKIEQCTQVNYSFVHVCYSLCRF